MMSLVIGGKAVISQVFKTCRQSVIYRRITSRAASSTSIYERKPEVVSENLSFRRADTSIAAERRPIVLLYGWLAAKARHIHRYGDFYLGHGFDVLHIKVRTSQVMWPRTTHWVIDELLSYVSSDGRDAQPLLVHGFSVGGYLYGETLCRLNGETAGRIRGQIFDSPVDFDGIPYGVSRITSNVAPVQYAIQAALIAYLYAFHDHTTVYYERSSAAFHDNERRIPSLMFYSANDLIGPADRIEQVMELWRSKGVSVWSKRWEQSQHVRHFHNYPVEYLQALEAFLESIGLVQRHDTARTEPEKVAVSA